MAIYTILVITISYSILWIPSGWLVDRLTRRWRLELSIKKDDQGDTSQRIGYLERFLILTIFLLNQVYAIAWLLALKLLLRLGSKRPGKEIKYILVRTLISFILAIIIGIALISFLKYFSIDLTKI